MHPKFQRKVLLIELKALKGFTNQMYTLVHAFIYGTNDISMLLVYNAKRGLSKEERLVVVQICLGSRIACKRCGSCLDVGGHS
jgi:hypothetical protein